MVHRNSWFTDKKWWFSIVMCMFTREYPRVPFLHQVLTHGFQPILIYPLKRHFIFLSSSPSKSIDRRVSLTNLASASLQWRTHFEKCWGIGQESISLTFGTSFPRAYQSMIGCVGENTFESMEITGLELEHILCFFWNWCRNMLHFESSLRSSCSVVKMQNECNMVFPVFPKRVEKIEWIPQYSHVLVAFVSCISGTKMEQ